LLRVTVQSYENETEIENNRNSVIIHDARLTSEIFEWLHGQSVRIGVETVLWSALAITDLSS